MSTCSTGPRSSTSASRMTSTSPPRARARSRSWVMVSRAPPAATCPCRSAARPVRATGSRPFDGSSATSTGASPTVAAAKATRCAMPPDSWCGYAPAACPTPRPTSRSSALRRAADRSRRKVGAPSATTSRARIVGSRASTGSWGSSARVRPHSGRRVARSATSWCAPSMVIEPRASRPAGRVPIAACASSDLPEPDSPTTVSARPRSSLTSETSTSVRPRWVTTTWCRWTVMRVPPRGARPGGRAGSRPGRAREPGPARAPATRTAGTR